MADPGYFSGRRRQRSVRSDHADIEAAQTAFAEGRLAEALAICDEVVRSEPDNVPATILKGLIAGRLGDSDRAATLLQRAIQLEPKLWGPRTTLASIYMSKGQWHGAAEQWTAALDLQPEDGNARHRLGICYLKLGQAADAAAQFERATFIDTGSPEYAAKLQEATARAVPFDRAEAITAEGLCWLGRKLNEEGNLGLAEELFRRCVELDPGSAAGRANLGHLLQQLGRFEEGNRQLEVAIRLKPQWPNLYTMYLSGKRVTESDRPMLGQMEALLSATEDNGERAKLHQALGKALEELGDYELAIGHFDEAHRLMAEGLASSGGAFEPTNYRRCVDEVIEIFDIGLFDRLTSQGSASEAPVFIIGMIRSGTTLLDQVLASHPKVASGGELPYWHQVFARFQAEGLPAPSPEVSRAWSEGFLPVLAGIDRTALRITDKQPENYLALGLIRCAFPLARFIHCRRNPLDTAVSIYTTPNVVAPNWSHRREDIVFAYEQYERLMDHWRSLVPTDRLLDIDYESLTSDTEGTARRVVAFCGLEWDDACLNYAEKSGAIRTPSLWQARQPVYTSSVGRWRRYEPWLGALRGLSRDQDVG